MALTLEYLPVEDLPPNPSNPKGHALDEVDASMTRFGYVEPIVIDERTGQILSGHGRREALMARRAREEPRPLNVEVDEQGRWLAPVVRGVHTTSDIEAGALIVGVNELVAAGGWNPDRLVPLLEEIRAQSTLAGTGFTSEGLDELLAGLALQTNDGGGGSGDAEDPPVPAVVPAHTRPGGVWTLGAHRLMCGDARDADHVARLLDGAVVNVAFTSPPYADRRKYDESSGFVPIHPDAYVDWFAPIAANVAEHLAPDGSWFVNIKPSAEGLDTNLYVHDLVAAHARSWGWHFATEFCWEKRGVPVAVVRRFKNAYEPVYQFVRGDWKIRPMAVMAPSDHVPTFHEPGTNASLQGIADPFGDRIPGMAYPSNRLPTFAGTHEALGHGAAFPVGLPAWFLRAYSDPGDTVLDPFAGSGSTLLAAEQEDRIGFGMELSAGYCDIICARYQRATGDKPTREGEPVDFLA